MSSFQPGSPIPPHHPPLLPPPPPVLAPGTKAESSSDLAWVIDQAHTVATKGLSWCADAYRKSVSHSNSSSSSSSEDFDTLVFLALDALTVCVVGCDTLGLASPSSPSSPSLLLLLPLKGKTFVVNLWGFARPALATVVVVVGDGADNNTNKTEKLDSTRQLSSLTNYWVVFGLFSVFDGILSTVTPFYLLTKACLLAWSLSPARPYGGRSVLEHAFEMINADDWSAMTTNAPGPKQRQRQKQQQQSASVPADIIVPRRLFRLAVAVAAFAAATLALGVCISVVLAVEGVFARQPQWTQAKMCAVAGACWPLYATLATCARTASGQRGSGVGNNDNNSNTKNEKNKQRQGPAAVQWLSYWPMYALFLVVVDPIVGWSPHYYSAKLAALAFLASPQTRGAYLIASFLLHSYGNQGSAQSPDRATAAAGGEQGVAVATLVRAD